MPSDIRDLVTAITVVVAVYGAGLATYTAVTTRRTTQRLLRTRLTLNVLGDTPEPRTVFLLSAANAGQRVVKIVSACIRFPGGSQFMPLEPPLGNYLPRELQEGDDLNIPIALEHVVQALQESGYRGRVTLHAQFRDVLGELHLSRPLRGNVEAWARLAAKRPAA